jgi:hypothetical protein
MKRVKEWLRERRESASERTGLLGGIYVDASDSRATRMGKAAMFVGVLLEAVEPVVTLAVVLALSASPTMAQTGGTIFGQDQSMVPNAVRQTVIFAAGISFLIGALTVIWGAFQYSRRQECMNCFIGGGLLMAIGGVIALVSYLSSGRAVTVDRTLN